jgi:hypothetical protein
MEMRAMREMISWACVFLVVLAAAIAHADGGCSKGWRDVTAEERATMRGVIDAAKKAVPAPPEGWIVSGEDSVTMPDSLCIDQESAPWVYGIARSYYHAAVQEARNEVMAAAAADMSAQMAAKQPRLDALTAKMNAISAELAAAAQKADYARTEELGKEIEKVGEEYKAVLAEGGTEEKMKAAASEAARDMQMNVVVRVNALYEFPPTRAQALPAPRGAQFAFRWSEESGDQPDAHALVLLGPWQPKSEGGFQAVPPPGAAAPAAQMIAVRVVADESRIGSVLESIDFSALAATLAR